MALAGLVILNRSGITKGASYIIFGIILWAFVLKSGVHATLAGVALGFAIPLALGKDGRSLLQDSEHALHPWVAFLIIPVFAFANAGVPLFGFSWSDLWQPLPLGIAAGLFIGKQIGVFGIVVIAIKLGLAVKPDSITYRKLYGASLLACIGFIMSLFIGGLAFEDVEHQNLVRLCVLVGSFMSGILGAAVLAYSRENIRARVSEA